MDLSGVSVRLVLRTYAMLHCVLKKLTASRRLLILNDICAYDRDHLLQGYESVIMIARAVYHGGAVQTPAFGVCGWFRNNSR
jgi:hypothetical protein